MGKAPQPRNTRLGCYAAPLRGARLKGSPRGGRCLLPANRLPREDGSGGIPGHSIVEGVGLKLTPSTLFSARLHRMPFAVEGDLREVAGDVEGDLQDVAVTL